MMHLEQLLYLLYLPKRLLHQDQRQDLEQTFGNLLFEGWNIQCQFVECRCQCWAQSRTEHGIQHGRDLMFDTMPYSSGQHADAGKHCRINGSRFLFGINSRVLGRRQTLLDVSQNILEIGLDIRSCCHC